MSTSSASEALKRKYEQAALAYENSLSPEPDTESTALTTQRKITLESLDLLRVWRPDVQVFNELLVEYPVSRREVDEVVPNNMVVVWPEPIQADTSFDLRNQPTGPFWMLEYVSKLHKRRDHEANVHTYEKELRVPYCLVFDPVPREMTLFRLQRKKYVSVKANAQGRCAITELDLEMALLDGWVRFWYRGELLLLPADLQRNLDEARQQLHQERQARLAAEEEVSRLRAQVEQLRKKRT